MDETKEKLAEAVSEFLNKAASLLDEHRALLLRACIHHPEADVRIVCQLKTGAFTIEGINPTEGKYVEIYRDEVAPLREVSVQ